MGQVPPEARRLATNWTDQVRFLIGDFSLLFRVKAGPVVHSTSSKMITSAFPG